MAASRSQFVYPYPRPMVTVDAVVFTVRDGRREVLLIERKHAPFAGSWAFPGGFVEMDETLDAAAARELDEETGLTGIPLRQFHAFGDPGRDPRGRSIAVAYVGEADWRKVSPQAADDARAARWFPADAPPPLAFDHARILEYALRCVCKE
ncbi:MAG TPA: NUDIX hydrolase [Candidatus Hydrogenedentes bacterium]|nr:NUDIX hydrolase [Candidatus Hydrogenedentota bacterium]